MIPLPKNEMRLEIGAYSLLLFPDETEKQYAKLPFYQGNDVGMNFFRYLLPRAKKESLLFLKEIGIDPQKLFLARPLAEPDENGEVLFLCTARLCGELLRGGQTFPRRSEEKAGMSLVFVSDRASFREGLVPFPDPELEIRFVIPLPFDAKFFEQF